LSRRNRQDDQKPAEGGAIRGASPGDEPDIEQVFRQNLEFVRRAVASSLGPGDPDLDDVVQEVFLVAMNKLRSFDGSCRITTWLYGINWRVVSQHRRRRKIRRFFSLTGEESAHAPEHGPPEADAIAVQASREVYAVLDRMTEKKRQVLVLYELEGYSGAETAEILGCEVSTVWTRLHYARDEFRERALKSAAVREWREPPVHAPGRNGI